ncbi:twin-arginine translocase TatA/TatE family subunit [Parvularcula dongshanensis]|uniref:Sec-independent protein translocase protein TatA n=1 Tax=Parvularcula dongshanensis TaxID=1173995 RepID=A0A840HYQ9_9PROT|nr:twin-arginine translocase TatA/TatE family subunit [Parvularcula dongshanensis]MBB4657709.1 sec-independent protein translocase protein TatA [Parvularcula dongshanensis]
MAIGWQQLLIVLILVLVLFGGRGRISSLMGDMAKGIKSFRAGLKDDDVDGAEAERARLEAASQRPVDPALRSEQSKTEV